MHAIFLRRSIDIWIYRYFHKTCDRIFTARVHRKGYSFFQWAKTNLSLSSVCWYMLAFDPHYGTCFEKKNLIWRAIQIGDNNVSITQIKFLNCSTVPSRTIGWPSWDVEERRQETGDRIREANNSRLAGWLPCRVHPLKTWSTSRASSEHLRGALFTTPVE